MTKISFKKKVVAIGHKLHTESFGDVAHPACLLLSGAMASCRFWTDVFCQSLVSSGFFVIRYDHRDVGESSSFDWRKEPYTLSDLAKDAVAILEAYGIQKAHMVGHSMGGFLSQQLAVDYPERILSLAMISSGPLGATEELDQPLTSKEQKIQEDSWKLLLAPKNESSLEAYIESFLPIWRYLNGSIHFDEAMARAYTKDLLTRTIHKMRAGNPHELLMRTVFASREKNRHLLKKISSHTLIIHGDQDPLLLPREGIALAHAIPKAKLVMIPKMGHMIFNRDLEAKIASLLIEHFTSQSEGEKIRDQIVELLKKQNVHFEHLVHKEAYTSEMGVLATGANLRETIKTLILRGKKSGKNYLACVRGDQKVDMKVFSSLVETSELEKLPVLKERFGIDLGGGTPFLGILFGIEVYLDKSIQEVEEVILGSGLATESFRLKVSDLIRLIHPKIVSFTQ